MRVKLLLIGLISSLIFISPIAVNADQAWVGDPGRAWPVPDDAERGMHVQWFMDSFPGESVSYLIDQSLLSNKFVNPTCTGIEDPRCTSNSLQYSALLPVCLRDLDLFCVAEFGVKLKSGEKIKAKYVQNFPKVIQNPFSGNLGLGLPNGSSGALFSVPEAKHSGGNLYYLSVLTEGNVIKNSSANLGNFSMRLFPVGLQNDSRLISTNEGYEAGWAAEKSGGSGNPVGSWRLAGYGFSGNSFCVAASAAEGLCAQRYAFPADITFYVTVRMQIRPSGWLHGRIYNPEISLTGSPGNYVLEVSASPVAVPLVYKMYRYSEMPQALKDKYDVSTGGFKEDGGAGCPGGRSACTTDPLTRNVILAPAPSDPLGMKQLQLWLPYVDDKATALLGTWSLRTLDRNETSGAQRCFVDGSQGITGIVTTNATQYLAGPPQFNNSEQSLEYKVAAPHLTPRGEVFYGTYDLLMRSDVARCVYGFSNAPIKGTISVTSDKGDVKIATEQIKEANGWVSLAANGFTYSSPTIKVKLSQEKPEPVKVEVAAPEATPAPPPGQVVQQAAKPATVSSKKSFTCVKGKMIKKVSGVNPKCPTGFKKK